jgi:ribose 5-phosphate isomerase B
LTKIAIGSDEKTNVTDRVVDLLKGRGFDIDPVGPIKGEAATWPVVARQVAESVARGEAHQGVLFCWTGTGVSIAANKVPGVRAALCDDAETARGARLWNDANVLCLSLRRTSEVLAEEILEAWFESEYEPNEEDDACLSALAEMEPGHDKD